MELENVTEEEIIIKKKRIETENEVETLKDLVDNSQIQYEEFALASQHS